jgi:predicted lipid-binding transport protein (Tim44 family)
MSNGFQFLDIILFAMIAAFLILRLRSVLGRHKDSGESQKNNERESFSENSPKNNANENIISLSSAKPITENGEETASSATELEAGISKIQSVTNDFDPNEFLTGAQAAFEMIIQGFADGNTDILKTLLNDEVYNNFLVAIRSREAENQSLENTLIRIASCEIIEASLEDTFANITIKLVSEQINITVDQDGSVVAGDRDKTSTITDIWTFARDMGLEGPNWMLIATRSLD